MKKTIRSSAICAILSVLTAAHLNAQPYPDYALEYITPRTDRALIRYYSPTQAVAVYSNSTTTPYPAFYTTVNLLDNATNVASFDMEIGYEVYDMEIVDDYLIMCGRYNTSKAFLGSLYIPDILTSSVTVNYHIIPGDVSSLRKMVAFKDPSNNIKVAAVGNVKNLPGTSPQILIPCSLSFGSCDPPYTCDLNFVIEATNPHTYPPGGMPFDIKFVTDNLGSPDYIDDVVLTDNFVVFIGEGYISGSSCLTVHPCSKTNILPDFDNFYYYPTVNEGYTYIGCHMKEDTIAIASRGSYLDPPSWSEYDTRIRVIDAASHVMISSQAFDLNDYKSDPIDLVYIPEKYTLVLLEDIVYPPAAGVNNYSFLFLNPYQKFQNNPGAFPIITPPLPWLLPYMAKGFFESARGLTFWSMDRTATDNAIVATGGDYWMLKTVPIITTNHTCYKPVSVDIYKLYDINAQPSSHGYKGCPQYFQSSTNTHSTTVPTISGTCY